MIVKSRHALRDRVRLVRDRVRDVGLERVVHLAVLLGPADEARELLRIRTAERVVQAHQPAAPAQEVVERGPILDAQIAGVALIDDDDVGRRELPGRREVQAAVDDRAAVGQQLAPVRQELRVVVLALGVGLEPGVDEHPERRRLRSLDSGGRGRLRRLLSHDRCT